jgi:hypothetical protein
MMLHLFDDLWLDKIIPKNSNKRQSSRNLENKINTLYKPVENSIHQRAFTKRCRRNITEGQWAVLNLV